MNLLDPASYFAAQRFASHLMMEGFGELWVTNAMMRSVRRGSVVADIGANLGYFTLLLADLTGAHGRVLSFEPNPNLARLLRKSVEVNGFSRFTDFHGLALGGSAGSADMDIRIDQPGGGRMIAGPAAGTSGPGAGGSVTLERFDRMPHALDVEFIKMDVEGFEPEVWKGMTGLLERGKPLTIFMELTVGRLADPGGFLDSIMGWGFTLEIIRFTGQIEPITREALLNGPKDVDHMLVFKRG